MLQLLPPGAGHFWGFLGTADYPGVFILPQQALRLLVPKQSTKTQCSGTKEGASFFALQDAASLWLARLRMDKGTGAEMEQDGGNGEGNGQTLTELFHTPKFLMFFTKEFWHTRPSDYDQSQE